MCNGWTEREKRSTTDKVEREVGALMGRSWLRAAAYCDAVAVFNYSLGEAVCAPESVASEGSSRGRGRIWKVANRDTGTHALRSETRLHFYWNCDGNRNGWLGRKGGECLNMQEIWSWRDGSNLQPAVYQLLLEVTQIP